MTDPRSLAPSPNRAASPVALLGDAARLYGIVIDVERSGLAPTLAGMYALSGATEAARARSARARLAALPPMDSLRRRLAGLRSLRRDAATEDFVMIALAVALDAIPAARTANEGYLSAAAQEIVADGHCRAVVAQTARHLIRTATFAPSVAEVLRVAEGETSRLIEAESVLLTAVLRRTEAVNLLVEIGDAGAAAAASELDDGFDDRVD